MKKSICCILLLLLLVSGGALACKTKAPQPPDHLQNGLALDEQNRFAEAITEYVKAIELDPDSAEAYMNRGYDYIRTLQFDLAIADFTKAIELNPDDETAYFNRGIAYINKGFKDSSAYNLAIADFSKVIELDPDNAKAYDNRGYAYALNRQYEQAAADLNKAIELASDPETAEHARRILGQIGQPVPSGGSTSGSTSPGAQVWELTENDSHQVVKIVITPFTNSGAFSETSDSPGWWIFDAQGNKLYKLPVGGNISHNSQGDLWRFVNFGNAGGGYQTLGTGEGRSIGSFPTATAASGTITFTTQSPLGSVSGTVIWSGKRIK